eukprot:m.438495 g.438495  ORF g.438495 m.438495 type:complete len:238 (+) comp18247_c0_seq1:321-1034(+)
MVQWDTECWGGDSTAWYCQKRIRPLLRGYSHAAACVLSPLYAAERLAVAKTDSVAAAVILEAAAQMMLFGASAAYHRGQWSMWGEALAARVDYVGIFAYIGFCSAPLSVAIFGFVGWLLILGSAAIVCVGAWLIFSESSQLKADRRVMVKLYTLQGIFPLASVTLAYCFGHLTNSEFFRILLGVCFFFTGAQLYQRTWPKLSEYHFTYHDLFHLFVVSGAFMMHCVNWHVLARMSVH